MFDKFTRSIWSLLKRAGESFSSVLSKRARDEATKQPEGYGGYTPPGAPTKPPPDGEEKKP
jgi:hypothetical protein